MRRRSLTAWTLSVAATLMVLVTAAPRAGAGAATATPAPASGSSPSAAGLAALPAAAADTTCSAGSGAFLRARLRGATSLDVDWRQPALQCDGGVRPDGHGIRVTFSAPYRGAAGHAHRLRFIFGIGAAPVAGIRHDIAANVTVIFEGERRLYSTRGDDRCTVDELREQALPAAHSGQRLLGVRARGFCIAPADAIGNGAALLVSRFDFSGAILLEDDAVDTRAHAAAAARTAH